MTWLTARSRLKAHRLRGVLVRVLCGVLASSALLAVQPARAEVGHERADASAKGAVGLAMLGAEAVVTVEALVGVKPWWAYALGGGLGAVAGGVGGYFVDRADQPALSMGFLVGGMVLAVPTTIAVLSMTAYKPPKNPEVDQSAEQRAFEQYQAARFSATPAAFAVTESGDFRLGVPAVAVVPVFSRETVQQFSLEKNAASVRVPVFNLTF